MAICDTCGNDYDKAFSVTFEAVSYTHNTLTTMSLVCRSRWSTNH